MWDWSGLGLAWRGAGWPPYRQQCYRLAVGDFIARACPDTLRSIGDGDAARGVVLPPNPGFPRGGPE